MAKPGERIKQAREEVGLTQAQLGEACGGWGQTRVSGYETGRNEPSIRDFELMAAVLNRPVAWLQGVDDAVPVNGPAARNTPLRDVPIVGFVIATPESDGYFEDMVYPPGAGAGYVAWPTNDPDAYARWVKGDSMQPRIRPGELVVVEPHARVSPGDDVEVRTLDGRKMIKQFLFRRGGAVTLGSINQAHAQTTLSSDDIEAMYLATVVPKSTTVKDS